MDKVVLDKNLLTSDLAVQTKNQTGIPPDLEGHMIIFNASVQGRNQILVEIKKSLTTIKNDAEKRKILLKKQREVRETISDLKVIVKGLFFTVPQLFEFLKSYWQELADYIEEQIQIIDSSTGEDQHIKYNHGIEWDAPVSEFLELSTALYEARVVKCNSKTHLIKELSQFFSLKIKNPAQSLTGVKAYRNLDNRTILLDKLIKAFRSYLNK